MKIILSGFGAMGQRVAVLAESSGYEIVGTILPESQETPYPTFRFDDQLPEADVIIDFSHPNLTKSILSSKHIQIPIVIATTGEKEAIIQLAKDKAQQQAIFFSPNMSYGVHVLNQIVALATALLDGYDIELLEKHHNQKVDAPSGTLNQLLDTILNDPSRAESYPLYNRHDSHEKRDGREIGVSSIRAGSIVGEHFIYFAGLDEEITISHRAQSKDIFANGALKVAKKLIEKDPGFYTFDNL